MAILLTVPFHVFSQSETKVFTRFEGDRITGLTVYGGFQVEVVYSEVTKAVAEISTELEDYFKFENKSGNVSVSFQAKKGEEKILNRIRQELKSPVMKLTVYTDKISSLSLYGKSSVSSADAFDADELKIQTYGGSAVNVLCSGKKLTCKSYGSSRVLVAGEFDKASFTLYGSARVGSEELRVKKLESFQYGSSNARAWVGEALSFKGYGSSKLYYRGDPPKVDSKCMGSSKVIKNE